MPEWDQSDASSCPQAQSNVAAMMHFSYEEGKKRKIPANNGFL